MYSILQNLPSTLSVLSKRLNSPKTSVMRYLKTLIKIGVVRQELDMFYLTEMYEKEKRFSVRFVLVMDAWYNNLPEYQVPSIDNPNPRGSAVKLVIRGHPHDSVKRTRSERHIVRRYIKKKTSG
jgi:hypothetical protein